MGFVGVADFVVELEAEALVVVVDFVDVADLEVAVGFVDVADLEVVVDFVDVVGFGIVAAGLGGADFSVEGVVAVEGFAGFEVFGVVGLALLRDSMPSEIFVVALLSFVLGFARLNFLLFGSGCAVSFSFIVVGGGLSNDMSMISLGLFCPLPLGFIGSGLTLVGAGRSSSSFSEDDDLS